MGAGVPSEVDQRMCPERGFIETTRFPSVAATSELPMTKGSPYTA
jgi:hypothetical protein